jgi:hypothetical protein
MPTFKELRQMRDRIRSQTRESYEAQPDWHRKNVGVYVHDDGCKVIWNGHFWTITRLPDRTT